ncbi:MAG: hypothetical protein V4692_10565, partial [Bdellovibrionota bacterium]
MRLTSSLLTVAILSLSFTAHAFRDSDFSGDDSGAVVVYDFENNGSDTIYDKSGVGAPLNLKMSAAGNLPTADGTPIRTNAGWMLPVDGGNFVINPKPNQTGMNPDTGYQSAQKHRTFLVSETAATK